MTLPFPFMTAFVAQQRWQTSFEMFEITTQSYNIPFVKFSSLQKYEQDGTSVAFATWTVSIIKFTVFRGIFCLFFWQ